MTYKTEENGNSARRGTRIRLFTESGSPPSGTEGRHGGAHAAHQRRNSRKGNRIPCREEQEKPGNGDGCSRHVCRAIAEAAGGEVGFPSEPDAAGRKTKVPIRNAIRHFTPHAHPGKSKTSPDQLTKRRFQYPEPVLNSPKLRKHNKLKINHNRLHINV